MDRNCDLEPIKNPEAVALRKESVDRNVRCSLIVDRTAVALRKESVDRNTLDSGFSRCARLSLSARRAWIEMTMSS